MSAIEITSKEFRSKQKTYFELADKGKRVIVKRGANKYLITPITSGDIQISEEMENKIEKAIQQLETGEITRVRGKDELAEYLAKL